MSFFQKETQPHRLRKGTSGCQESKMWGREKWAASAHMHTIVYKISHQDPLCNTRKHTERSVITYMEKEPPPKHVYVSVEMNQLQYLKRKKKKDWNSPIYSSSNGRKKNKTTTLTLLPSGHSDLGWGHIPGARVACIPRLECPGAEGSGSRGQV